MRTMPSSTCALQKRLGQPLKLYHAFFSQPTFSHCFKADQQASYTHQRLSEPTRATGAALSRASVNRGKCKESTTCPGCRRRRGLLRLGTRKRCASEGAPWPHHPV
jgi:hypothetical protein